MISGRVYEISLNVKPLRCSTLIYFAKDMAYRSAVSCVWNMPARACSVEPPYCNLKDCALLDMMQSCAARCMDYEKSLGPSNSEMD